MSLRPKSSAIYNPFYAFDAAPFSDAFLLLGLCSLLALLAAIRTGRGKQPADDGL